MGEKEQALRRRFRAAQRRAARLEAIREGREHKAEDAESTGPTPEGSRGSRAKDGTSDSLTVSSVDLA